MGDNRHAAIELSGAQSTLLSRYQVCFPFFFLYLFYMCKSPE